MISIVIPALNERDSIVDTVVQVRSILEEHGLSPYEIIVVDDGSTDGTGTLAENAGSRVVSHPHNIGYGRALKNGIAAAMHDTIVITDADGSYPLDKIPELFHRYQEGFDMVVGARTGPYFRESALKEPLRVLLRWIVEFTAGRRIPDINSGLRVFSKRTVTRYFNHLSDRFSFTTSLTLAYMMNSKFVCYEEIDYYRRSGKSKVRLFRD